MNKRPSVVVAGVAAVWLILSASVAGQTAEVVGTVRDETGHVLPGVSVDVRDEQGAARETITDAVLAYRIGLKPLVIFMTTRAAGGSDAIPKPWPPPRMFPSASNTTPDSSND